MVNIKTRICCHLSCKVHKYRFRSCQSAAETLRSRSDVNTVEIHICTRMTSFSTCTFLCPVPGKLSNLTSSKPYLHNCLWNRSTDVWSFQWNKFTQSLINKEIIPIEYSNPLKSTADKWHRVCRHTNTVVQSEILFKTPVLLSQGDRGEAGPSGPGGPKVLWLCSLSESSSRFKSWQLVVFGDFLS